jgi:hypothetical protein
MDQCSKEQEVLRNRTKQELSQLYKYLDIVADGIKKIQGCK